MTQPIRIRKLLCTAISLALSGAATGAGAQVLDEIVVTAQKRSENLQDVPAAITALSSDELDGLKYRDAGEISAQVPNLLSTNPLGDGFPIFSVRGVSMSDYSLNQSSPVASYVDEVYKGNPAIQGVQVFDLERVEVLRGPQGTLYGKNSTGGAVNFITRKPSFGRSGYLRVGAGDHGRKEAHAAAETPLGGDTLALRVAGTWVESDGWFRNRNAGVQDGNAIDEYGARATLLWQPGESVEVLLRAATGRQDAVNYGIQAFNITADGVGAGLYGLYNLLGATTATDSQRAGLGYFDFDSDQDLHRVIDNDAYALTVNWEMQDALTLTSITSWDDGEILNPEDVDGTSNAVLRARYSGEAQQFTQDLRVTSDNPGPFNFIAGLYYADEDVRNATTLGFWQDLDLNADGSLDSFDCLDPLFVSLGLPPATQAGTDLEAVLNGFGLSLGAFAPAGCQAQNDFRQERSSAAAYLDTSYLLRDAWTLHLGLRYTRDETRLHGFSARLLGNDGTTLLNTIPGDPDDPFARAASDEFSDGEWTGKVGIDFRTGSGTLWYASYSHGYRNGAYNAQAFFDPSELTQVAPETLDSLEVGVKAELAGGRASLGVAAFHYAYDNQQFLNVDAATLAQTLINIDRSEITGIEVELAARVLENLTLRSAIGLLDSEVKDGTLSGVDLAGNELPLAPEVDFNIALDWNIVSAAAGTLALLVDANYVGDHFFDVFNVDRLEQAGYWLGNARLQFTTASENWQAALWCKNVADEEYRTSVIDLQASFGFDYSHIGAPRTWGAELSYRF